MSKAWYVIAKKSELKKMNGEFKSLEKFVERNHRENNRREESKYLECENRQ